MKFILSSLILLGFFSDWKANEDIRLVTETLVASFAKDSIKVFHKYSNLALDERLEEFKLFYDYKNSQKSDNSKFNILLALNDKDLEINFHGLSFKYYEELKFLKRSKRKKILSKSEFVSRKKGNQMRYISKPIISTDGNKAMCYISYSCGAFCESGGIQLLEKINGKWIIIEMVEAWTT